MPRPVFINPWNSYPSEQSPCDGAWTNQCAIRMSLTFNAERTILINSGTYSEPKCAHGHARGAESLGNWLWKYHLKRPTIFRDGASAKRSLQEKKGVIFFKDCFTQSGQTVRRGDHIDLWNRGITKTYSDPANKAAQVWFWELT